MAENDDRPERQDGSPDPGGIGTDRTGAAADEASGAGYGNNADKAATPSDPAGGGPGGSAATETDEER